MKNIKYFLSILTITVITSSCSLFNGGGGGGHCPAYGTSIENDNHQDLNNAIEIRQRLSESM